jgi:DNA-binding CsgD family transcriptional regulator
MRGAGAMPVVETAYRLDLDDDEWIAEMARIGCTTLGADGMPVHGAIVRSHDRGFEFLKRFVEPYDRDFLRSVDKLEALVPRRINAVKYRRTCCQTATELAVEHHAPALLSTVLLKRHLRRWGVADVVQVQGAGLDNVTVGFTAALREASRVPSRLRHTWELVATHMAAGFRLRRALSERRRALDQADAIFDHNGRTVHAQGVAAEPAYQEVLREAALSVDRARSRDCRDDPERALTLWQGLFEGRWSVLEVFDTDGRAFMVACENDPAIAASRALTRRERQIAELAARGHSDKLIAYTLGLSASTVVRTHLARALAKLGATNRLNWVRIAKLLVETDE